jgi:hypothetical protein
VHILDFAYDKLGSLLIVGAIVNQYWHLQLVQSANSHLVLHVLTLNLLILGLRRHEELAMACLCGIGFVDCCVAVLSSRLPFNSALIPLAFVLILRRPLVYVMMLFPPAS